MAAGPGGLAQASAAVRSLTCRRGDASRSGWHNPVAFRIDREAVYQVALADVVELDEDCWFDGRAPTCREVAEHSRRITDADLGYGGLTDGDTESPALARGTR